MDAELIDNILTEDDLLLKQQKEAKMNAIVWS